MEAKGIDPISMGSMRVRKRPLAFMAAMVLVIELLLVSVQSNDVTARDWPLERPESASQQGATTMGPTVSLEDNWLNRPTRMAEESSNGSMKFDLNSQATLADLMLHVYSRLKKIIIISMNVQSYKPELKYVGDPVFVDSENPAHRARCRADLDFYKQVLDSVKESDPSSSRKQLDHWRLADSFGRPEAGSLRGGQYWLGAYEQCLGIKMERAQGTESIESQYCLGLAKFPVWSPDDTAKFIRVALCLPVTCTSSMFNDDGETLAIVERMMKDQFVGGGPYRKLKLDQVYCLPHKTSFIRQYSAATYGFFATIGAFVGLSLIATVFDYCQTKSAKNAHQTKRSVRLIIIESFSLIRNWNKFARVGGEPRPNKSVGRQKLVACTDDWWSYDRSIFLSSIAGIKCVGLYSIIAIHSLLIYLFCANNTLDTDKMMKNVIMVVYLNGNLAVDSFFTISGLISAFFLFKSGIHKMNLRQWVVLILHRYWRLTPVYLLAVWFGKHVSYVINSGPKWEYGTSEEGMRQICIEESWWAAFLHLSDLKSPQDNCVPVAYYIANEMKFFLVAPIFLILINKSILCGYLFTIGTILASMAYVASVSVQTSEDVMKSIIGMKPEATNNFWIDLQEVYTKSYSRIGAYLIGILAGHLLYLADRRKLQFKISKPITVVIWILVTLKISSLIIAAKFVDYIELNGTNLTIAFGVLFSAARPLWAIGTSWIIIALAHGQARWLSRFLGAKIWQILTKLNYAILIVNIEVMLQTQWSSSQAYSISNLTLIAQPIVIMTICIIIGLLVMLMIENPLTGIEEIILPKRPTRSKGGENQGTGELKTGDKNKNNPV